MAENIRTMEATPEQVFAVLADGWLYPVWVVGASRMRSVDASWPAPGAELHHSFGVWPFLLNDKAVVLEWDPPRRMVIRAHGWPVGEAQVTMEVKARGAGSVVRILEDAVEGPGRLVPAFLRSPGLHARNTETLRRLAFLAEGGAR
jgi:hypothetical protein